MRQTMLALGRRHPARTKLSVDVDEERRDELVQLMARAIVSVAEDEATGANALQEGHDE